MTRNAASRRDRARSSASHSNPPPAPAAHHRPSARLAMECSAPRGRPPTRESWRRARGDADVRKGVYRRAARRACPPRAARRRHRAASHERREPRPRGRDAGRCDAPSSRPIDRRSRRRIATATDEEPATATCRPTSARRARAVRRVARARACPRRRVAGGRRGGGSRVRLGEEREAGRSAATARSCRSPGVGTAASALPRVFIGFSSALARAQVCGVGGRRSAAYKRLRATGER